MDNQEQTPPQSPEGATDASSDDATELSMEQLETVAGGVESPAYYVGYAVGWVRGKLGL